MRFPRATRLDEIQQSRARGQYRSSAYVRAREVEWIVASRRLPVPRNRSHLRGSCLRPPGFCFRTKPAARAPARPPASPRRSHGRRGVERIAAAVRLGATGGVRIEGFGSWVHGNQFAVFVDPTIDVLEREDEVRFDVRNDIVPKGDIHGSLWDITK